MSKLSDKIKNIVWVDYEMFNKNDSFGKVMVKNFQEMGIPLNSIEDFDNLAQIKDDFEKRGFDC